MGDELPKIKTAEFFEAVPDSECTLTGFYFDKDGNEGRVNIMHSQLHFKLSADFEDVAASPNDVGLFFGYHANIDRSLLHWQLNTQDSLERFMWHYPKNSFDVPDADKDFVGDPGGPYGLNGFFSCASVPEVYDEFVPFMQVSA